MNRARAVWGAIGAVLVVCLAIVAFGGGGGGESTAERTARLASGVRCPTCQGLSAEESDAKAAGAVKTEIARRVAAGETDAEIRQALVNRYGQEILLTPSNSGLGAVVWAVPVVALLSAGAGLVLRNRWRRRETDGPTDSRPWMKAAVAAAVLVVATGVGVLVARTAGERLPGDSATGTIERGPTELLLEARSLLSSGQAVEALKRYDQVLVEDPLHPEALAYRGWLIRLSGNSAVGLEMVEAAMEADPDFPDAHLFKGVILLDDLGRREEAVVELRRFLELDADHELAEQARQTLARAEAAPA